MSFNSSAIDVGLVFELAAGMAAGGVLFYSMGAALVNMVFTIGLKFK